MVLSFLGVDKTESEIRALIKTKWTGTNPGNLAYLQDLGFQVRFEHSSVDLLRAFLAQGIAPITFVSTEYLTHWSSEEYAFVHAVIVVAVDGDQTVLVNDPYFPQYPIFISISEFDHAWRVSQRLLVSIELR